MEHADLLARTLLLGFAALILLFIWRARRGHVPYVRPIPGVTAIEEAVGRATEMGRPVVFAMSESDAKDINTHNALSVLGHVARLTARMRSPLLALVQRPDVYPFVESTVRSAYQAEGAEDALNLPEQVRYLSDNCFVYAAGVVRTIEEQHAGCALFFGAFGFYSLLMTEPGAQAGVLQIAGDPQLGQVPFFVCTCDYTVFGEEFYAAGAYVSADPGLRGALVSQDLIKVALVALVVVGLVAQVASALPLGAVSRVANAVLAKLASYQ
jgi:hypothetical protein